MKVKEMFIIELNFEEAVSLKKWLGERSEDLGKAAGICSNGNKMLSDLYEYLPNEY